MKIKNEKQIFDLYVDDESLLRPKFKAPFIQENDGRVWATDGHMLIMVNQECVSGKYEIQNVGSGLPVRDYNADIPLSVSDIQDAFDKCPQEPDFEITYKSKTCPECDGDGRVEAEYYANTDDECYIIFGTCPICDGDGTIKDEVKTPTGRMVPTEDSIIKLGKGYFHWWYLDTIVETCKLLDMEHIRLVRTHKDNMSIIELSKDIHIGFMPVRLDDDEKAKKRAIRVKTGGGEL